MGFKLLLFSAALAATPFYAMSAGPDAASGVAWEVAASDAAVDKAFALARQQGKPLFFYWGANWCPPCNQVKATLFSRPDFVGQARTFIPVYVDGDKPGAQKVAARFRVTGYPTMVLFKPDGTEITRLPGEVDPERYLLTLAAGLQSDVPVKELVRLALEPKPLSQQQWRLLAFYSWDTDQQQVFKALELGSRLSELAAVAPAGDLKERLALKAVAARAQGESSTSSGKSRQDDRKLVERILSNPASVREQRDLLVYFAEPMVKYLTQGESPAQLAATWDAALAQMLASTTVSRVDLLDALDARVDLWKLMSSANQLDTARRETVRATVSNVVAQVTDRYERQAIVPSGAHILAAAGMLVESDQMLKSELSRAVAPYYHMLGIASNAKKRGDKLDALRWYELAWQRSEGPATRLQWGASYVRELTELAPTESARIASASSALVAELQPNAETFFERNQRSLGKLADSLKKWQGSDPARTKVVAQVKQQLSRKCARLPKKEAGRLNCESLVSAMSKNDA